MKSRKILALLLSLMTIISTAAVPGSAESGTLEKNIENETEVLTEDFNSDAYEVDSFLDGEKERGNMDLIPASEESDPLILSGEVNTVSYVVGELMSHDIDSNGCINIGGTDYQVSDDFEAKVGDRNIVDFVLNSNDKTVVATLVNDEVTKLEAIADVIKPEIKIVLNPTSVSYEDGKFDNDKINVSVSFGVTAKAGYYSKISDAINDKGMSWNYSGYELELGKGLNFKKLISKYQIEKSDEDITVEFGKTEDLVFEAYLNNNAVIEAAQTIKVNLKTEFDGKQESVSADLNVTNVTLNNEIQQNKEAETEADQALIDAQKALNNTTIALSSYPMEQAGYTKSQQNQVNSAVQSWISQILVAEVLSRDTGSSQAFWDQFCESAGFGSSERKKFITKITKSTLKKLGVDVSPLIDDSKLNINWEDTEASTEIRLYDATGKNTTKLK